MTMENLSVKSILGATILTSKKVVKTTSLDGYKAQTVKKSRMRNTLNNRALTLAILKTKQGKKGQLKLSPTGIDYNGQFDYYDNWKIQISIDWILLDKLGE